MNFKTYHRVLGVIPGKTKAAVVLVLIALTAYGYVNLMPLHANARIMQLPSQVHDFSTVLPRSQSTTVFNERNRSWAILFIDRLSPSCGCTSVQCDRSIVMPGETFSIKATLTAPDHAVNKASRIILHGRLGRSNVSEEFRLSAAVRNLIEIPDANAESLNLGTWHPNQLPATINAVVKRGAYPLGFDDLSVMSDSPCVAASAVRINQDAWKIQFQIQSGGFIGACGYPVIFHFARQGKPLPETVVRQAYLELLGPVVASPPSLLLSGAPGQHIRKVIEIGRRSDSDVGGLEVSGVSLSSRSVNATCQNVGQPSVIVDYLVPQNAKSESGEIVISASDHGRPYKLKVSYLALVS